VTAPPTEGVARRRGRPPRVSREEIIEAAIDLFSRFGYRGTTLVAIAAAVGVKDTSVLHYFPTKADILEAALKENDDPADEQFREELKPGGIEALRAVAVWGARMQEQPRTTSLHIVLQAEALYEGSELHERYERRYFYIRRELKRAIEKGVGAGEIRDEVDAYHEATMLLAVLDGLRVQWFYSNGTFNIDEHVHAYVEDVIARIGTPAKASRGRAVRR
jgi:AcrR family transcriptional regulator